MKIKIIKPGVTDASSIFEVGANIEYPDDVAKRLVEGGYAESVEGNGGKGTELTPDAAAKKLDKYKVDELMKMAANHGVEIDDDAKKVDIIAALIEAKVYTEILG